MPQTHTIQRLCWNEEQFDSFPQLIGLPLRKPHVYIIWREVHKGIGVGIGLGIKSPVDREVIYVGKSENISRRIMQHQSNEEILRYNRQSNLRVTWAAVPESKCDGVEQFLADRLRPRVGEHDHPDTIPVYLPW